VPRLPLVATAALAAVLAVPAQAGEVFVGAYVHGVDTPLTLETEERGADLQLGYRFARIEALSAIGSPQPYVFGSVNTRGDTSFVGAGVSWRVDAGPVYVRPGVGLVVHDGPELRVGASGRRTDLGSRVLFSPEVAVGTQLGDRLSVEASWVHISHARLFDGGQNPGIDMMGVRLNWRL
jgi:lipid A 3-O-deacylase